MANKKKLSLIDLLIRNSTSKISPRPMLDPMYNKSTSKPFDTGFDRINKSTNRKFDTGFNSSNSTTKPFDKGFDRTYKKTGGSTAAWTRKEGKDPKGGLNAKGVASYRAANPGSKLKTAVTTKPSKIKPGSEAAGRRKSFCSRMSGMKKKLTSAKTANDPNSRINKSLRKWNC